MTRMKYSDFRVQAVLIGSALALSACGGGSSSSDPSLGTADEQARNGTHTSPTTTTTTVKATDGSTATYSLTINLAASQGSVTAVSSAGTTATCTSTCTKTYASTEKITLTATPLTGYNFSAWSGACAGTSPTCTSVTMSAAQTVTATFAAIPVAVTPPPAPTPMPVATAPVDLCSGLTAAASDKNQHPQPTMSRPAKGVRYTDPVFGSTVIRITDVKAENGGKAGVRVPMYSTVPAWNADETRMIIYQTTGYVSTANLPAQHLLYDGKTYQFIKVLNIVPGDVEHIYWHPTDPDILYYPENLAQNDGTNIGRLIKYHVSTDTKEVIASFTPKDINGGPYPHSNGALDFSHPKYMAFNGSKLGLRWRFGGPRSDGTIANYDGMTATYNLENNSGGSKGTISPWVYIPGDVGKEADGFVLSSPDKMGISIGATGTVGVRGPYVLNPVTMNLFTRTDGSSRLHIGWDGHATLAPTAKGEDLFIGPQFDVAPFGTVVTENLQTGEVKTLIGEANGWGFPPAAIHVSGVALQNRGWIAASIVGGTPGDNIPSTGQKVLEQELVLTNVDTGAICRVAHHYSVRTNQGYWAEPHVVISPSGTRLLFGSDWQNSDSVDSYVVELPTYKR